MITTSNRFLSTLTARSGQPMWPRIFITLKNGSLYRISVNGVHKYVNGSYVLQGSYTGAAGARHPMTGDSYIVVGAGSQSLPIGQAIGKSLHLELSNSSGAFNDWDFYGARIQVFGDLTVPKASGAGTEVESIRLGTYTVVTPVATGLRITVNAVDDMYKADAPYNHSLATSSRITARMVFTDWCSKLGFTLTDEFTGVGVMYNYTINKDSLNIQQPENTTFRRVLGDLAGLDGANVWIGYDDLIHFIKYDRNLTSNARRMDLWLGNPTIDTDNITITGVSLVGESGGHLGYGTDDYSIECTNGFFNGSDSSILTSMYAAVGNLTFTQFSGKYINWPVIELMDAIQLYGPGIRSGVYSYVTDYEVHFLGGTTLSNSAAPVIKAKYGNYGTDNATRQLINHETNRKISSYEREVDRINSLIVGAFGLYLTEEPQSDGSVIYSLHNQPTLAESTMEYRVDGTAGLTVRTRANTSDSWSAAAAITTTGDAVFRILRAHGIEADWINAGTLQVLGSDGTIAFSVSFPEGSNDSEILIDGNRTSIRALSGTGIDATEPGKTVSSETYYAWMNIKYSNRRTKLYSLFPKDSNEGLEFRKDAVSGKPGRMFLKASAGQFGTLLIGGDRSDYPLGTIAFEDGGNTHFTILSIDYVAHHDSAGYSHGATWEDIVDAPGALSTLSTEYNSTKTSFQSDISSLKNWVNNFDAASLVPQKVDMIDTTSINDHGSIKDNLTQLWDLMETLIPSA